MVDYIGKKLNDITKDREVVSGANATAVNALGSKVAEMLQAHCWVPVYLTLY